MELKEIKTSLSNIAFTLNQIEIRGKQNLNQMLGCIQLLDQIVSEFPEACDEQTPVLECTSFEHATKPYSTGGET